MTNTKTWTGLPVKESIIMTEDRDKWRNTSMVWPTLGSRTAKEQNRIELYIKVGQYWDGWLVKKVKGSPQSITERTVPELIPVLSSQPAGDVSRKPGGRLPLLSARPAVTPATLKRTATNFAAWWTEAQWVWTVCLRLLPDSIMTVIWTRAFCAWVQHANPLGYRVIVECNVTR